MKRLRNNRRGFTLAEVLIVVAIVIVLAGVSVVGVVRYQRSLKQLELDGIAKEIFVAAQNHLTMAESQDYLGMKDFGTEETEGSEGTGVYYFVVGTGTGSYANPDTTDAKKTVLSLMLPFASVDETVRLGGSYVIRYQKSPGIVLDVFYAEKNGRYPYTLGSDDYGSLFVVDGGLTGDAKKSARSTYSDEKAVLGWYGGEGAKALIPELKDLKQPEVVLYNEETLWAEITDLNVNDPAGSTITRKLVIEGLTSGNKRSIVHTELSSPWVIISEKSDSEKNTYKVLLDDVTQNAGEHFFSICCSSSDVNIKNLIPGENIRAYVVISSTDALVADAQSEYSNVENSLFDTGTTTTQALIGNFRHLENLDANISRLDANDGNDKLNIDSAMQTADLSWPEFRTRIAGINPVSADKVQIHAVSSYPGTENGKGGEGLVLPVNPSAGFKYDGNEKTISEVEAIIAGEAGVFGHLSGGSVSDLTLLDFDIQATGASASAGALAGSAVGTTVYNVLTYTTSGKDVPDLSASNRSFGSRIALSPVLFGRGVTPLFDPAGGSGGKTRPRKINSAGSSGGLIGSMSGGGVYFSAAALFVESSGSTAGGLIGTVSGSVTVTGSYSGGHTEDMVYNDKSWNVKAASGTAGGLVGLVSDSASLSVDHSYTTCSAYGSTAGGFIGSSNNTTVSHSYATGRVSGTNSDPFIAVHSGDLSVTNCHYVSLKIDDEEAYVVSDLTSAAGYGLTPVRVDDWASSGDHSFILLPDQRENATCYDEKLSAKYQSRYYFPTIQQLYGSELAMAAAITSADFSGTPALATHHYGDWQVPIPYPLDYAWVNGDTLDLEIDYTEYAKVNSAMNGGKPATILVAVTGETSKNTWVFRLTLNDAKTGYTAEVKTVAPKNGALNRTAIIDWTTDVGTTVLPITVVDQDDTKTVTLTFDDITKAGGKFAELCGTGENALIPGENVTARVNTLQSWSELLGDYDMLTQVEKQNKTDNSLFAKNSTDSKALIAKIRHLQNLDPVISNVSGEVTTAEIDADQVDDDDDDKKLVWNDGVYSNIYQYNSGTHVSTSFFGIYNPNLTSFDGKGKTIFNLAVTDTSTISAANIGNGNAGLFRLINNDLTVQDLRLSGGTFTAASGGGDAGGLAGAVVATGKTVSFTNVLVEGKSVFVTASSGDAGGLIGSMTGGSVTKSAAAVTVSGSGSAGGLIGSASGVTVTASYSGGQTSNGKYSSSNYNVTGSTYAGGLIGSASDDATISYSYSTCSASGATAGGLVGSITGGTVNTAYATGLISGTTAGAFAGSVSSTTLSGENKYYDFINNEVTTAGSGLNPVGSDSDVTLAKLDDSVTTFNSFVQVHAEGTAGAAPAEPYDSYLTDAFGGKYDLKTVAQLGATGVSATGDIPDFVATHYGDWPSPEIWVINTPGGTTDTSTGSEGYAVGECFYVTLQGKNNETINLKDVEWDVNVTSSPNIVTWKPGSGLYFTEAGGPVTVTIRFKWGYHENGVDIDANEEFQVTVTGVNKKVDVSCSIRCVSGPGDPDKWYHFSFNNDSDHTYMMASFTLQTSGNVTGILQSYNVTSTLNDDGTITVVFNNTNQGLEPRMEYPDAGSIRITGTNGFAILPPE